MIPLHLRRKLHRKRQNYETSVAECFGNICDEPLPVSDILVSYSI